MFRRAELAMLQTCQYVELSLSHALVQGRGACSPLTCGGSNNKPPQKQYLHCKDTVWLLDLLRGKQQSLSTPPRLLQHLPCLSQPCLAVQEKRLVPTLASPAAGAGSAPTYTMCQVTATTGPLLGTDPSRPVSAMQRRRTRTHRGRGEHLHSL